MSKTSLKTTAEWNQINWRKLERHMFKLQTRIYKASQRGDVKAVRRLQKTLMKSWSAKCIAVRRVTQDNQGKKTAGVDGVKSLSPEQRLALVKNLKLTQKSQPTRRVWIPKPGTDEKRPLGIPTMHDRALQALVKLALEPEWEAQFEPNSYGFRPGRSVHDAIGAIFCAIRIKAKYVLDADIAKCFDRINHEALLEKLNTFPTLRRQIKAWLKSGVMDGKTLFPTSEGTPQGGVISPLLANIALHGMENQIKQAFPQKTIRIGKKTQNFASPNLIRYADDFVILHEDLTVVQNCQQIIAKWLEGMGLELKPSKTLIAHTFKEYSGQTGFDFLGFNIRQYPAGCYRAAKDGHGNSLGFNTLIKPSQRAIERHLYKMAAVIDTHKTAPQEALIKELNPLIVGWANYYSTVVSGDTFQKVDHLVFQKLWAWAKYRCRKTSLKKIKENYWQVRDGRKWSFETLEGHKLSLHSDIPITRHVKVQDRRSPYEGDWVYWSSRLGKHPEIPIRVAKLLKQQKMRCAHCGLYFKHGDLLEVHHKTARKDGGKNVYSNLELLHRHCHDQKHGTQELGKVQEYDYPF